jgi:hypothetical protein
MVTHFTHFVKVAVFSGSSGRKVCTEENIETVQLNVKWKTNPNYLQHGRLRYVWQFFHDRLIHRDLWPALSMCIEAQGYHFQHLL